MTEEEKKEIKMVLENNEPCLYLGAGFSFGAKKGTETIPLGDSVKKKILSEIEKIDLELAEEIQNKDLKTVCQELKNLNEELYIDTLINLMKGYEPTTFQNYIVDYRWKKIFTVNIDDIVEKVFKYQNIPLQVVSSNIVKECLSEKKQTLYKLHGCINDRESGYVFSTDEYTDFISDQHNFKLMNLIIAFETSDFFVVGTELNELELDFFISIFKKKENKLMKNNIIFINPNPTVSFKRSLEKNSNFKLIQTTTEDFFNYIHLTVGNINKVIYQQQSIFKRNNFRSFEMILKEHFNRDKKSSYVTKLYFGDEPDWEDLTYEFIINYSGIESFYKGVINNSKRINIYHGPLYSGKTSCLKFIFKQLSAIDTAYCLYNFSDSISLESIRKSIQEIPTSFSIIYLFYDDIGEYYSLFEQVLDIDKRITIIGTSNTYIHNRKKYSLLQNSTFDYEVPDSLILKDIDGIRNTLLEKGLAGSLTNKSINEWYQKVNYKEGIVSSIYSITLGNNFKSHYDNLFNTMNIKENKFYNLLLISSFCYLLDIPYIKQYMLTDLNYKFSNQELAEINDFIKITSDGSIKIRTKYIADSILSTCSDKELIIKLIKSICVSISSLITDNGRDYIKNVYEYLTKYKNLLNIIKLNNTQIKYLYDELQKYYSHISYYWLQLGIVEQKNKNYDYALQHFNTAHSINTNSYGIMHAIARNYCKQAVDLNSSAQAFATFEYGKSIFLRLIKTKEYTRSKAYSIHSFIYELMEFHKKFRVQVSDEDRKLCFELLNESNRLDNTDTLMSDLQVRFFAFLQKSNHFSDEEYSQYEETLDY